MAQILNADDPETLRLAAAALDAGQLVAIPTETVYGLAADATNGEAVAAIFAAKGRPRFNPLIAHVASLAMARETGMFDAISLALAKRFWPGPLTIVVPLAPQSFVHPLVTAGQQTVALRMPRGFGADVVALLGRPVAAPSANRSGRISPTSAANVAADLGERVPLIVDAGPAPVGVESTIVKVEDGVVRLLRPGGVTADDIEAMGLSVIRNRPGVAVEAPGMLASHYAPRATMRLNAESVEPGEALLAFGPDRIAGHEAAAALLNLSPAGDLGQAAANLFAHMHALDATGVARIAVEPVPMTGLGEAINDRLARAAAPRKGAGSRDDKD
ncbi:L-threonylcarbamoyladenylate synthase [Zhengella sp. ZM62]|uniref:L-threonylcarbamoyladenylate synthase n=1 Tax=Zhengella sedimenti TaxID=3390035 RepID=UPI003975CF43